LVLAALAAVSNCPAELIENFDSISSLTGLGWVFTNNSTPPGTSGWFQGNSSVFPAFQGDANTYIAANFLAAAPGGNISLWLITPQLRITNGDVISFYTRTETNAFPGDRLELRLSTAGASTNTGSNAASVGDFTSLLLAVNSAGGGIYPQSWSPFSFAVTGLSGTVSGRLAFRYAVTDTSESGDYIGIDSFNSSSIVVPEPGSALLCAGAVAIAICQCVRRQRVAGRLRKMDEKCPKRDEGVNS